MSGHAFQNVTLNGASLGGIADLTLDARETLLTEGESGQIYETIATVIQSAPKATFACKSLGTLIGLMTGGSIPYVAITGLVLVAPRLAAAAVGYQAAVGASWTFALPATYKPLLLPERIGWQIGGVAEITVGAYALSVDGSTAPLAVANNASVPAVGTLGERYVLTAATQNGVAITGVQSVDLTIDHKVENNQPHCYDAGLPHPVLLSQPGVGGPASMSCRLRSSDVGQVLAAGNLVLTFTKLSKIGVGITTGTVTVTLRAGNARTEQVSGVPGMVDFLVHGTFDGANAPLTLAAA